MVVSGDDFLRLLLSGFGFAPDRCELLGFRLDGLLRIPSGVGVLWFVCASLGNAGT